MYLVKELEEDVTDIKTVENPEQFFNKSFLSHLMLGTRDLLWRDERVHALRENYAEYRVNDTRYKADSPIYEYGAMKDLTNRNSHMIVNLKRFMIRCVLTRYPGLSCKWIRAIIDGITNDCQHE